MKPLRVFLTIFWFSVELFYAASACAVPVPAVGCPSDGQNGPLPPPEKMTTPDLPASLASRLAWYDSGDLGVLAPRGWKCFGLYGSDGTTLFVVPDVMTTAALSLNTRISGQGIQVGIFYGDTSGRFEAAKIAAQLFPSRRAFVDSVRGETILEKEALQKLPFPRDRIDHFGPDRAEFYTPANDEGIGTMSRLLKSKDPIQGVATIDSGNDVTMLVIRLNSVSRDLMPIILHTVPIGESRAVRSASR